MAVTTSRPARGDRIDPKLSIAAQAHAQLRHQILTIQLQPNEALSEKELSLRLGVSRTPVREALIRLAEEGLVDIFPQRGTFVAPIRVSEVMEARFIREALEVTIVELIAGQGAEDLLPQLYELVERQEAAVASGETSAFMPLDEDFHRAMSRSASLPRAWKVIHNVKGQLDRVRYLSLPDPEHLKVLISQHRQIVEAIRLRDPDLAASHMRGHLQEVFKTIRPLLRERPDLFV